jgi:hypothetical protein
MERKATVIRESESVGPPARRLTLTVSGTHCTVTRTLTIIDSSIHTHNNSRETERKGVLRTTVHPLTELGKARQVGPLSLTLGASSPCTVLDSSN